MADQNPETENPEAEQVDETAEQVEQQVEEQQPARQQAKSKRQAAKQQASPAAEQSTDDDSEVVEEIDYEDLQRLRADAAELKKLQGQLKDLNKQLTTLKTENDGFKREKMTAEEKLKADAEAAQQRVTELQQQLRSSQARLDVAEIARELKVSPRTAEKLILRDLAFDEDGKATNIRELLEAEIAADPNIVQRAAPRETAPNNADSHRRSGRQITQADLNNMSTDEINNLFEAGKLNDLLAGKVAYITV